LNAVAFAADRGQTVVVWKEATAAKADMVTFYADGRFGTKEVYHWSWRKDGLLVAFWKARVLLQQDPTDPKVFRGAYIPQAQGDAATPVEMIVTLPDDAGIMNPLIEGLKPNAIELQADAEAKMIAYRLLGARIPALAAAWQRVADANQQLAFAQLHQAQLERQPDIWTRRIAFEQGEVDYFAHLAYYKAWDPDVGGWVDAINATYQRWEYDHINKVRALQGEKDRFLAGLAGARAATHAAQGAFDSALKAYGDLLVPYQDKFSEIWAAEYPRRKAALMGERAKAEADWTVRKAAEKP
jgi:hypothetical protein